MEKDSRPIGISVQLPSLLFNKNSKNHLTNLVTFMQIFGGLTDLVLSKF